MYTYAIKCIGLLHSLYLVFLADDECTVASVADTEETLVPEDDFEDKVLLFLSFQGLVRSVGRFVRFYIFGLQGAVFFALVVFNIPC